MLLQEELLKPEIQSAFFPEIQAASNFQLYFLAIYAGIHSHFRNLKGSGLLKQQHVMEGYWANNRKGKTREKKECKCLNNCKDYQNNV